MILLSCYWQSITETNEYRKLASNIKPLKFLGYRNIISQFRPEFYFGQKHSL